ncbi:MAG: hypothetical protein GXY47_11620 [Acidobacteria bacterium]|nr:hypothetical protein [Acidobacteriota bacterium]
MKPKLLFCNVDVDTDLASVRSARQRQSCLDARFYFLPCGGPEDRILLDAAAPEPYRSYLSGLGLGLPGACSEGEGLPGYAAFPWGWSRSAIDRFRRHGADLRHPPLEAVRAVNNRRFCHEAARGHGLGIEGSVLCASAAQARAHIRASRTFPLVLKPEHGNAGIGLVIVGSPGEADAVDRIYSRPGSSAVIEPWVDRSADLSSRMELDRSGRVVALTHHRALVNRAGVYFGNLLLPEDPVLARCRHRMEEGATIVARGLHAAGYFGPAGLDWVVHTIDGTERCALVDVNARQPMSLLAYSLRDRLAPGRACLLLFAPRRRHPALTDYASWHRRLEKYAFDPGRGTGILLFTPLSYTAGGTRYRPLRHGFFIAADTGEELGDYGRHLRNAFKTD